MSGATMTTKGLISIDLYIISLIRGIQATLLITLCTNRSHAWQHPLNYCFSRCYHNHLGCAISLFLWLASVISSLLQILLWVVSLCGSTSILVKDTRRNLACNTPGLIQIRSMWYSSQLTFSIPFYLRGMVLMLSSIQLLARSGMRYICIKSTKYSIHSVLQLA